MLSRVQTFTCPCCGGHIGEAAPLSALVEAVSSPTRRAIVELLSARAGRPVMRDAILERVYGGRADGGPDTADKVIMTQVSRLRREIEPFGWTITHGKGGSGERAQWKLIPLEAGA